uniref:glucuronate isomerase n=1 Tax=Oceanispirochaeta sp. TaxID=2035350 RepID=UPI002630CF47
GTDIRDSASLVKAIEIRHQYFHDAGCRLSDHGLETCYAAAYTEDEVAIIFSKALAGQSITPSQQDQFKTAMMVLFGRLDAEKSWTKQIHLGALRSNNTRMLKILGPDTGFDSVDDKNIAGPLAAYLNLLDSRGQLPKTILYNLNPRDNEVIATMLGNFQDGSVAGKIQMGSGWWFLDQKDGMERQMEALSQLGLLRRFVGMLTDSRSFLSYTRHEYFRRILCNILGKDMEKGLIPHDFELVGAMVREISYENARDYFGF